jgi:hypothetical protein
MPGRQYGLHFAGPFGPARSRSDPESAPVKISGRRLCLQHAEHPGASGLPPALSLALTSVVPGSTHRPSSDRRPGCGAHTPRGVYGCHWPDHRPRLQRWSATWRALRGTHPAARAPEGTVCRSPQCRHRWGLDDGPVCRSPAPEDAGSLPCGQSVVPWYLLGSHRDPQHRLGPQPVARQKPEGIWSATSPVTHGAEQSAAASPARVGR